MHHHNVCLQYFHQLREPEKQSGLRLLRWGGRLWEKEVRAWAGGWWVQRVVTRTNSVKSSVINSRKYVQIVQSLTQPLWKYIHVASWHCTMKFLEQWLEMIIRCQSWLKIMAQFSRQLMGKYSCLDSKLLCMVMICEEWNFFYMGQNDFSFSMSTYVNRAEGCHHPKYPHSADWHRSFARSWAAKNKKWIFL